MRVRWKPTPSMAVAILALVLAASGVTWAATALPRNSVGSSQVKNNSLKTKDIRNGHVRNADLGADSVNGAKVATDGLTGDDILETSLGQVPSAATADTANSAANASNATSLAGSPASDYVKTANLVPARVALSFGESRTIASAGPVSLVAQCRENVSGDQDELRLLAQTSQDGAFMQGDTPHSGPGGNSTHLDVATPEDNRTIGGVVTLPPTPNAQMADDDIDQGFVFGPDGSYVGLDEGVVYALHVGSSDCLFVGAVSVYPAG